MPIDQNQQNQLTTWLNNHAVRPNCPACGRNNWAPGDVIAAPTMIGNNVNIGDPSVPMVQLICTNCSYVMLFAAVPIGLVR